MEKCFIESEGGESQLPLEDKSIAYDRLASPTFLDDYEESPIGIFSSLSGKYFKSSDCLAHSRFSWYI